MLYTDRNVLYIVLLHDDVIHQRRHLLSNEFAAWELTARDLGHIQYLVSILESQSMVKERLV